MSKEVKKEIIDKLIEWLQEDQDYMYSRKEFILWLEAQKFII